MNFTLKSPELRNAVDRIVTAVRGAGGRGVLVGGCVRDALLGLPVKDVDLEVFGLGPDQLKALVSEHFKVDLVGEAFGVLKLRHVPLDVSIPRRESKSGLGHKAFDVLSDPTMSFEEAALRRDFTINAMGYDVAADTLLDPYGGQQDLQARILRHTSVRFTEDPLRVLRGMQFIARFDLSPAPETVEVCRGVTPEGLACERIFDEWKKLILSGVKISSGLEFLRTTGWLQYYPELETLVGCEQEPEWHPEGDVWIHTLLCMDAFAEDRVGDEHEDLVVGFAVLCHDLGKPLTTTVERGRIRSIGHCAAGEPPTRSFMRRMTNQESLAQEVVPLVTNHLRPLQLYTGQAGDGAIRRLAVRVKRIDRLVRVETADQKGRGPTEFDCSPQSEWLLNRARELEVRDSAPAPVVMGRHLIDLGMTPGPRFGPILQECYDAQIEGIITNTGDGIAFARKLIDDCPM